MAIKYVTILPDGKLDLESSEESSSDVMTEEVPDTMFGTDAEGRSASPTTRSMTFSTGQSFYVPWDKSFLDATMGYVKGGIGAAVVIGALVFVFKFGIELVTGALRNVMHKK